MFQASIYRSSKRLVILIAGIILIAAGTARASESDPWTYAHIPLADSAPLVSERLTKTIQSVIDEVNSQTTRPVEDTALEFAFFSEFRSSQIRDVTWGQFERCIDSNDCDDWPQFERIQMYPAESVFHAANWRYIPSSFHLASIVNVCGVRIGADKLTHFFDDGFHYFNALRSKRRNLEPEDIRQLSMTFEKTYMGTRITGIVSRADIEANLAGVRFYSDFFSGNSPIIGREPNGSLVMLRSPDICEYVTEQYDERVLPNDFTYSQLKTDMARKHSTELQRIISEREQQSAALAQELTAAQLESHKQLILARRIPMTRWQRDFPKMRIIGHASGMVSQWVFDPEFREVTSLFGFNPLKPGKLKDRKPVRIQPVDLTVSMN